MNSPVAFPRGYLGILKLAINTTPRGRIIGDSWSCKGPIPSDLSEGHDLNSGCSVESTLLLPLAVVLATETRPHNKTPCASVSFPVLPRPSAIAPHALRARVKISEDQRIHLLLMRNHSAGLVVLTARHHKLGRGVNLGQPPPRYNAQSTSNPCCVQLFTSHLTSAAPPSCCANGIQSGSWFHSHRVILDSNAVPVTSLG